MYFFQVIVLKLRHNQVLEDFLQVCLQTTSSFKKYDLRRDYKTVVD